MVRSSPVGLCLVLGLVVSTSALSAADQLHTAPEAEIKAAFLYHFGQFVDWPEDTLARAKRIRLCVLADESFAGTARSALHGKTLHDRPVVVDQIGPDDALDDCHILFIGDAGADQADGILKRIGDRPILTVGDLPQLAAAGTVIGFTMEQAKIRFLINAAAARRAGIRVSSQLMKLAVSVLGSADGGR
jgi:uncharacterized protein DUF4154